ncbi:hypothetical protein FGE12_14505 [Aggregicoccus sp. 17bor-14]|uniref:hypothetical protein n=1 Tax=Myxococcaceae TaxID=31 RepID=UPI00129C9810|nr:MULTISPECIES: hypothetical protein [Myxococcaceae]MBF5043605.1 hypothetical protein [Simulacricoccus sp. 17bor-14]MRI89364.1 hypothetical protein [Aggregicoccus sp. 17bor-14]
MPLTRRLLPPLLALLATACAPEQRPQPTHRVGAPLALSFAAGDAAPVGELRLVLRVEARAPLPAPAQVALQLPRGVRLLEGPGTLTSTVRAPGEVQALPLHLALDAAPASDLVAEAKVAAPGFGARARALWRFGAAAPLEVQPRPRGPELPALAMDGALP